MKNTSNRSSFASSLQQPIKHVSRSAMAFANTAFNRMTSAAKRGAAAMAPKTSFARAATAPKAQPVMAPVRSAGMHRAPR